MGSGEIILHNRVCGEELQGLEIRQALRRATGNLRRYHPVSSFNEKLCRGHEPKEVRW